MQLRFASMALLSITLLFTACKKDPIQVSVEEYLAQNNITAQQSTKGLYYVIEEEGSTEKPVDGSIVVFDYRGSLANGTEFDNSYNRSSPLSISLPELIEGVQIGGKLIGKGGKITLYIPSEIGYGSNDGPGIPANSMLIFEMELHDFTDGDDDMLKSQEGLYMIVEDPGDNQRPVSTSTIVMDYDGYLTDGTIFDSSIDKGEPLEIQLSALIQGMQIGLSVLGKEGKGKLIIPPHLGYGANPPSDTGITPTSLLIFDITLLEVK